MAELAQTYNMSSAIPLIDFDPFLNGSARDREHVASTIDAALSSVGFIYLSNHGIDQCKVDECFNWVSSCSYRIFIASMLDDRELLTLADILPCCRANVSLPFPSPKRRFYGFHLNGRITADIPVWEMRRCER